MTGARNEGREWFVLRSSPGRTLALAAAFRDLGAWTPTWTRRRRLPRSPMTKPVTEACIPTFTFIPAAAANDLPVLPKLPYSLMRFEGALIRIADRELDHLRKVADKPLMPASQLPRPGRAYRIVGLGFDGLSARVITCTTSKCFVAVEGFAQPLQIPPSLLHEKAA
jgi:hypothetical protein